jgi:hypothetical protein
MAGGLKPEDWDAFHGLIMGNLFDIYMKQKKQNVRKTQ